MSRSTQYIGLTAHALEWVKQAIRVEEYDMTTGMFDDVVRGKIYHLPPPKGPNKQLIAREVIQCVCYSGGPMIFTRLYLQLVKESGQKIPWADEPAYSWVINPNLPEGTKYDRELGHYFV